MRGTDGPGSGDYRPPEGIHVVAKPTGPVCNIDCEYCFYLEKQALFAERRTRMSDEVLARFIRGYVESQPTPVVDFVWQGGEPTLRGLGFFRRVVELQAPHRGGGKTIHNALQTNGTLLDDAWCAFLKENGFTVGISLDGPREVHDRHRVDRRGRGTFDQVMRGLGLLQRHGIEYNVLCTVTRESSLRPLEVYGFLKEAGVEFIQFAPVIERPAGPGGTPGLRLAGPAPLDRTLPDAEVTPWSVRPEEYGDFLVAIYEAWVRADVGTVFVMNFEWALNAWLGNPSPICVHARQCGGSLVVEHDGDVYACDHYVYPEHRLGSVLHDDLVTLGARSRATGFGVEKETALPRQCRECPVLAACRGGCPKHRFLRSVHGEPGLHYLCAGYLRFFLHIRKYCRVMAQLLEHGLPASHVMQAIQGPLVIQGPTP